jgi:anthranilate phosphoribosyltransferase
MSTTHLEHPFAKIIRILGKGKKGSRSLTQKEAYFAMRMILEDKVEDLQLGAFLMLMRVKEETPEELAGFVQAVRVSLPTINVVADLDWPSYAGKRRHLPWFILSSLLLAENNIKVLMHGSTSHTEGRLFVEEMLPLFALSATLSFTEAEQQLKSQNFAYLSLAEICPTMNQMIHLRNLMGLRSPVHTLVRLINPFNSQHSIQGIFHPGYRPIHQEAALLLKQKHIAVLKGEGGETERNPDMDCLVQSVHEGELSDEVWPALFARRHIKPDNLEPKHLLQLWRNELENEYAIASIIGTTAISLKLLGKVDNQSDAHDLATLFWKNRHTKAY